MMDPNEKIDLGVYGRLYSGVASAKVLDFFIEHQEYTFTQTEVAKETNLSNKTTNIIIKHLEKLGLLKLDRKIGQAKLYKFNGDSKAAQLMAKTALEIATIENEISNKEQHILTI